MHMSITVNVSIAMNVSITVNVSATLRFDVFCSWHNIIICISSKLTAMFLSF